MKTRSPGDRWGAGQAAVGVEQCWGEWTGPSIQLEVPMSPLYDVNLTLSSLINLLCDLERAIAPPWTKCPQVCNEVLAWGSLHSGPCGLA